jgi:hypothetical protein
MINLPGLELIREASESLEIAIFMSEEVAGFDSSDLLDAESKVIKLKAEYPRAALFYEWAGKSASSPSGFQARLAARALAAGESIEEATVISKNYSISG